MDMKRRIGLTLRELRAVYDINGHRASQQDIADAAQISIRYYHDLENGTRMPSLDTVEKLAAAFGLSLSAFCQRLEKMDK